MVKGLDSAEDLDLLPLPLIDGVEGGSRSMAKRKNSVRNVLSERFKYRHNLNMYRLKKHSKCSTSATSANASYAMCEVDNDPSQTSRQLQQPCLDRGGAVEHSGDEGAKENRGEADKNASYPLTDDTDVPLDHNEIELSYNIPKSNAVNQYMCSSNSTTNTTSNMANANSDILSVVSSGSVGGTRLVRKDIVKLGRLELLSNIENYVQVNFSNYRQFYDRVGPIRLSSPLSEGLKSNHVDISLWNDAATQLISQNSSKRKVYNIYWLPKIFSNIALRAAIKFVEDCNIRDGRSIKREIECHLYMYQRFQAISKTNQTSSLILQDDWPTVEVLGYYLDKKDPGQSTLISRKLTGPDFFYIIRSENNSNFVKKITPIYEFNKLDWCITALNRISQFGSVGIRHNDIKPDNIVLDVYFDQGVKKVDVKIIDLGAASMEYTKEFTGGTPWYESPEQKLLEYYTKKNRNSEMAHKVNIDISSDAWGAGLSIVEVLIGKRVVDYIKQPYGIGLLNYVGIPCNPDEVNLGCAKDGQQGQRIETMEASNSVDSTREDLWWNRDEYWEISPELWVQEAKKVLGLMCKGCTRTGANLVKNEPPEVVELQECDSENTNFNKHLESDENMLKGFKEFYFCEVCKHRYSTDRENICKIVARYVFNSLVVIDPKKRKKVQEVANQLRLFVTQAISYFL